MEPASGHARQGLGGGAEKRAAVLRFEVEDVTAAVFRPEMPDDFDRVQATLRDHVEGTGENNL